METGNVSNFGGRKNQSVIVLVFVVLVVVCIGLYFYIVKPILNQKFPDNLVVDETPSPRQELTFEAAGYYLQDMVPEKDVVVLESFLFNQDDGLEKVTLIYETAYSIQKNLDLYKAYLNKNGWKINEQSGLSADKSLASINAQKNGLSLSIKISLNSSTNKNEVEILKVGNIFSKY